MRNAKPVRDDFFLMTDEELAREIDKVRAVLAMRLPLEGRHIRALEEGARRLHTLVRVSMPVSNDNHV